MVSGYREISKRLFSTKFLTVVAALGLSVGAASAATFDAGTSYKVSQQNSQNIFKDSSGASSSNWSKQVGFTYSGDHGYHSYNSVSAGAFRLKADDLSTPATEMDDFLAYCLTPWTTLTLKTQYKTDPTLGFNSVTVGRLGALVANAWTSVTDATSAAAFQVVAWEIVSEDEKGPGATLSFDSGAFKLKSSKTPAGVLNLANSWLSEVSSGGWAPTTYGFTMLQWQTKASQNLLTVAPVPLPATGLLLLGGFGILAGVKRRKRAA